MEHDVVLTRKDGSTKHFRIYGRSTPNIGEIVTLPIDGQIITVRLSEAQGPASTRAEAVRSVDQIDVAELEEV